MKEPFKTTYSWACKVCGCQEFEFIEQAEVTAGGCIDENDEFTIDDVLGYNVITRSKGVRCAECGKYYRFAGTQGGVQS